MEAQGEKFCTSYDPNSLLYVSKVCGGGGGGGVRGETCGTVCVVRSVVNCCGAY